MTQFDSLGGMNVVFSADIAAAMKAIDAFGATLNKVTSSVAGQLKGFDASFEAMNKAVSGSAAAASKSFDAFDARFKQLAQDAPTHTGKVKQSLASIGEGGGAQKAEAGIRSFGTTLREVTESASANLRKLGSSFEVMETLIAGAVALKGFEKFKELDRSLAELQGALEETGQQFAVTRSQVLSFADSINAPVAAVADSVRRFVQVQFTVPEALNLSRVALQGARAAMVDSKVATDALVTTLRAFHIPATEAARTMGQLVTAGEQSAGGFAEFATSLTQLGPLANQFNFKLEDTLGILRLLTNQSGSATEATVKFRAILQELATVDPYSKQGDKLREVLGTTIELALASKGPVEVFKKIITAANGSSSAIHELVGSGRAAAAFIRIAGEGVEALDTSVQKFRDVGVKTLTEAYERQKNTITGLLSTSQKLVSNAIQVAFERNAEAIKSALKTLNDFLTRNKDLVSGLTQAVFYFSASVVALNAFRGAVFLTAKAMDVLASGIVVVQSGVKLLAGLITGNLITGFAAAAPKITALAVAVKELALTNIGVDAFRASAGLKSLSDGGLVLTQTLKGVVDEDSGLSQSLVGVGQTAHTAEQRVAGVAAAIGRLASQTALVAVIALAFGELGFQVGKVLAGVDDIAYRTSVSLAAYDDELQKSIKLTKDADDAAVRLKASGDEQISILRELITLQRQLNQEGDPGRKKTIANDIGEKAEALGKLKAGSDDDKQIVEGRIEAIKKTLGRGQAELEQSFTKIINDAIGLARRSDGTDVDPKDSFVGRLLGFAGQGQNQLAGELAPVLDKLRKEFGSLRDASVLNPEFAQRVQELAAAEAAAVTPTRLLEAGLLARSKAGDGAVLSDTEAAKKAHELSDELGKQTRVLRDYDDAKKRVSEQTAFEEHESQVRVAVEAAEHATTNAEKSIAKLGESFASAGVESALDRRLTSLSAEADQGVVSIHKLNTAIELTEALIAASGNEKEKSNFQKALDTLNETKEKLARGLLDIEDVKKRAAEDDRNRRQKEVDAELKQLDAIKDETLRNLGLELEAEKAAALSKKAERIRAAEELRKSPNADAAGLADKQVDAANRAYDAELARIERNQTEKEKGYATARAAAQRLDDEAKRLALLAEAEELKAKAVEARKRGDLRTEAALREQVAKLIQESGDRTQELLNKEKDVLRSVKERFDLAKQEVETRVRLGEGGAGIVSGVRSGLSAIAGASDASSFRAGVRDRFGQSQTETGAKELFGTVKQLLEAEFAGFQQQEREARKSRNTDDVFKAQQGQKDVAEKYRILNEELGRTVKEIKSQPGGKPGAAIRPDTLISGREVRPDETAPPGVRIVGPQTKDAGAVDAEQRFKRGEIKIDDATPITVTVAPSTKPLKIDNTEDLRVHVTNPAPGSKTEESKNASTPVSGPVALGSPGRGIDVGGGGVFKAISDAIALSALGASSPQLVSGRPPDTTQQELDRVSRQPMTPENFAKFKALKGRLPAEPVEPLLDASPVGPPGFDANDFVGPVRLGNRPPQDQLDARAGFVSRQQATVAKNKADKETRARAEAARRIEAVKRTSSPKDAQRRIDQINKQLEDQFGAPGSTPESGTPAGPATTAPDGFVGPPVPGTPATAPDVPGPSQPGSGGAGASPVGDAVQKTFDAVAGATANVAALGDKLLAAVQASGNATLSAMTTFGGKLSDTVDQLNDVTAKVKAIEDSATLLRIEGRS